MLVVEVTEFQLTLVDSLSGICMLCCCKSKYEAARAAAM